jgi:uracil phosphoribosyltransferase
MRNKHTPGPIFRSAAAELGRILLYEAVREWLPTSDVQVETPLSIADATYVDPTRPIKVVPVLRAGLVLLESAATLLPATETYHVGYVRDASTLEPHCYLNKLPSTLSPDDLILVSDPILATGGTMVAVMDDLVSRGADSANIRILSAVAAPPALQKLNDRYPGLKVYTGMIDAEVDDAGYIVPGVGDAGDRAFGTPHS